MATPAFRRRFFRIRVALLVVALCGVGAWALRIRATENRKVSWDQPHRVVVCPLVAMNTDVSDLTDVLASAPSTLETWAADQNEYWTGTRSRPFAFEIAPPQIVSEGPPWLPEAGDSFWTRFRQTSRFLDYLNAQGARFPARTDDDSRIYVYVFRDLDRGTWEDRLSVGTRRGRLGVVFASNDPKDWGNVLCVILHETLHTVGAKDHRRHDDTIAFPSGYADPNVQPRYPQKKAEIMALGIPISESEELRVENLDDVTMGLWTAKEIGWR